jgi:phosphoglycolate phosphatase-like HAD superfamily hydrolase
MIENEKAVLEQKALTHLRERFQGRMGAITEWPGAIAQFALGRLQMGSLLDVLITREDVIGEAARLRRLGTEQALQKPHPFSLLEALSHLDPGRSRVAAYIGHSPDDMRMARAAQSPGRGPLAWALLPSVQELPHLSEKLRAAGGERIFDQPSELAEALCASV